MTEIPEISIITVNYNGLRDTCDLIDSIRQHVIVSYELIVIDNGSVLNESEYLEEYYPKVICVRSEKNLGFAGGNNLGMRIAKGKYIFLLNNDTYVKDNSISFLIKRLESDSRIGGVSPKIKFAFPPENIQYAGYTMLSPITLRNHSIGFMENDHGQYNTPCSTAYLHGAAMMLKREVVQRVGPMPEIYFLYYEEIEWCTRMRRDNYILYYEPRCTVFHKESQSTGKTSPLRTFYITRNRLLYAYRNLEGIAKYLSIVYQLSIVLVKNGINFLIKGRTDLIKSSVLGIYNFFILKSKNN